MLINSLLQFLNFFVWTFCPTSAWVSVAAGNRRAVIRQSTHYELGNRAATLISPHAAHTGGVQGGPPGLTCSQEGVSDATSFPTFPVSQQR